MTLTASVAGSALAAVFGEEGPDFILLDRRDPEVAGSRDFTVSYERLWPVIFRQLRAGTFRLADLVTFAEADPLILEAMRNGLVNTILDEIEASPARRRRVLSNAARFVPLRDFSLADQHDPDADILLVRALNDHVRAADVPALMTLAERLLETDTVDLTPKGA
ncbi:MAG TPA: hypothetical protein PLS95_14925 [Thermoanaerobaculales bacterium]|nr:hypothetical protein [Thermoanaerobaculales bacterium]HQN97251.1 hypothetical protein [Thermoanaerobaculales bacterium]HQP42853.1 hypothetical protein [Thermoanaerobaculales bacterium]